MSTSTPTNTHEGTAPVAFATATRPGAEPVPGTDLSYFLIAFDSEGNERTDGGGCRRASAESAEPTPPTPDDARPGRVSDLAEAVLTQEPVSDVFLFSHGWMGDVPAARAQYGAWILTMAGNSADVARARAARPGFLPLLLGIHWPSLPWGNEELAAAPSFAPGGAVAEVRLEAYARRLGDTPEVRQHLRTVFSAAATGGEPEHLPPQVAEAYRALDRATGLANGGVGAAPGCDREGFDPEAVYQEARAEARAASNVSFGVFGGDTLLAPLRTLSFWKMKERGRLIGEQAVYPLLVRLLRASGDRDVRFHLAGHSFGCIVASAAIAGPAGAEALPRPVESLTLLQGALSLWAFCDDIPSLPGQAGYFHRIVSEGRVRGPVVATRSRHDRAVGTWYPRGARLGGQVAFGAGASTLPRYGGIGTFGVQGPGLELEDVPMQPEDGTYAFAPGGVYNLEASDYVRTGGGFSGAHSDLNHPEVAHAVWAAALG